MHILRRITAVLWAPWDLFRRDWDAHQMNTLSLAWTRQQQREGR